jgi:hypothetical protein
MKSHHDLFIRLLTLTASFASILGVTLQYLPNLNELPWWVVVLAVIATLSFLFLLVLEINSERCRSVYRVRNTKGIQKYMLRWIQHGGRVAIWTRDMSWVNTSEAKDLLRKKASTGELIICLPKETPLTTELKQSGAEVFTYSALDSEPASRFTIAHYGREGSRVAVGHGKGDYHIIDEFSADEHPAYHLARDLVRFARGGFEKLGSK